MSGRPIRVLLVEDETLLRATLAQLLQLESDFRLVAQVGDGAAAVEEAAKCFPDVVLMDLEMPKLNGIEATRRIKAAHPEVQIVVLTKFGDDDHVFSAIKAGALGYVLKDAGLDEIRSAVRAAFQQEGFLSRPLVSRVMHEFARIGALQKEGRARFAELTRRELEVLELLGAGLRNRAIAERLFLSEKTVRNHLSNILAKLHVNDRTEAALLAQKHGL